MSPHINHVLIIYLLPNILYHEKNDICRYVRFYVSMDSKINVVFMQFLNRIFKFSHKKYLIYCIYDKNPKKKIFCLSINKSIKHSSNYVQIKKKQLGIPNVVHKITNCRLDLATYRKWIWFNYKLSNLWNYLFCSNFTTHAYLDLTVALFGRLIRSSCSYRTHWNVNYN